MLFNTFLCQYDVVTVFKCSVHTQVVHLRGKKKKANERQEVASVRKGETRPGDITLWHDTLQVPPLLPTDLGRVQLVSVTYELEVSVRCSSSKTLFKLNSSKAANLYAGLGL